MQATLNGWIEPGIDYISGERRARQRYALRLPLEYRVLGSQPPVTGSGFSCDLSSGGIAIEVDTDLHAGCRIELSLQWPIALQNGTPLKLVLRGHVLRREHRVVAVKVLTCQFRTQRRSRAAGSAFAY